jgi:predicted AAA+ superfamily ATPase
MLQRHVLGVLRERLAEFPAAALLGSRQVGKTTLAKVVAAALGRPAV